MEPPKFTKDIVDQTIVEGTDAVFTCDVTGMPRPEITWYKNYREVFTGRRYEIKVEGHTHTLIIKNVEENDIASIECHARNNFGTASSRANLNVQIPAKIIDLPPRYLDGLMFCKGDTIMTRVQFRGLPTPEVTWTRNDRKLEKKKRVDIHTTTRHSSLLVEDSTLDDSGIYTVTVSNSVGTDTVNIPIKIIDRPSAPEGKPIVEDIQKFSVKLSWQPPSDDGGSEVTGYIIEKLDLQTGVWRRALTSKTPQCTVDCLEEFKEYRFRVFAENFIGISEASLESDKVLTREHVPDINYDELYDASFRGNNVNIERIKGDVLSKYIICEELGRGAFGVVHRAIERSTDKNWAAKFIHCKPHEKEIVRHEIDVMNDLHHPKLMQLHEAFDQAGEMVMILELLTGGELFDRLVEKEYDFTEADCITYMRQICQGVQHMHGQNIIHLDLKPENVMCVTKDSNDIKIIDFGLAQRVEEGKAVKVLFGTAEFCAPEVINFEPVSFSTDMWSLGVVTYVLLSGYSPFAGETDHETFANINRSDFDFEDEVWDNISEDARDFINKLLNKDKSKRMTIDEALAHPWLNGSAERKLSGTPLSREHHKEYRDRMRHKEDDLDILPIGRLSRDSAIFRREGDKGVLSRQLIMELPPHAPVVGEPLEDVHGFEGSHVEFTCKISGKPLPKITWYHDGEEIQEKKNVHMTYKDNFASLFINDLEIEDAGKIRCKASNEHGEVSTTARLTVEDLKHRRKRKAKEAEIGAKLKLDRHEYDRRVKDTNVPPTFTLPLVDQVRKVGETVELTVTVTCRPEPDVFWYHNNKKIRSSERYDLEHIKGVYRLIIHELEQGDAGQWRCEANNAYGHAMCSCELKVIETIPEGASSPKFTKCLEDVTVEEGSSVTLECKFKGHPNPQIEWYKDRKLIRSGRHYRITSDEDHSTLTIHDSYTNDTGRYMCRAVNMVGSTTTESHVKIQSKRYDDLDWGMRPGHYYHYESAQILEAPIMRYKMEEPPNFTAKLRDKTVPEGSHVRFMCSVTGIPPPRITWFHDRKDITKESNYFITNQHGLLSLEIYSVSEVHSGKYTCRAVNSEGEVTCEAYLHVLGTEREGTPELDFSRPHFKRPLQDISVTAGEEVNFTCLVAGRPLPTFKWQKDGSDVTENKRIYIGSDSDGGAELMIRSARTSDSGLYSVIAQSSAGRTKCSAYLRVKAKSKSSSPPESPALSMDEAPLTWAQRTEKSYERAKPKEIPGGRRPHFSLALPKVVELDEGDKLHLDCTVDGWPRPVLTWHKGHRDLSYDYRHRTTSFQNMHSLEIQEVMATDAGEYIAKATNACGTAEVKCQIKVNKRMARRASADISVQDAQKAAAPFFIKHLPKSMDVMKGYNIQYDCIVEGEVTLIKHKRSEMKTVKETLEFSEFEGNYRQIPSMSIPTMMGATATIPMSGPRGAGKQKKAKCSPRFIEEVEEQTLRTGSIATLSAVVEAEPEADISWYKDGKELKDSNKYEMFFEDGAYHLEVYDTDLTDTGMYKCIATNEMGSAQSRAKVTILDEPTELTRGTTPRFPPRFVVELEPRYDVVVGDDVKFVCIINDAVDHVHWEKDGRKLYSNRRCTLTQESDGTQELDISVVRPDDAGVYSCVAKTTGGEVKTTTTLSVSESAKDKQPVTASDGTPNISKPLRDKVCKDGASVTLECSISGSPRPQVSWFKDGEEIRDSQDFQISTIGDQSKLTIVEVFPEDEGNYTCKASNTKGQTTTSCHLLVEANTSQEEDFRITERDARDTKTDARNDADVRRLQYHGLKYPKGKLSPPDGTPSVKDVTHNSMTVTWSPPHGVPISCILAYHLEVCRTCDKRWKVVTSSCQGTQYDVRNLAPDTEYTFRIRVANIFGVSKPSQTTIPVRTRQLERWGKQGSFGVKEKTPKLTRRHSHYIKVENSVSTLLNKTEECEFESKVGTIPFKRNSSIRMSLPLQRRPVTSVLPGSRRESVCSKESRRSLEESSVFTDETDEVSSLKLNRMSTSTEDDSCNRSSSAASMNSIPEESDFSDFRSKQSGQNNKTEIPWKSQDLPESSDILSAPYSDDTKLAWVSRSPPTNKQYDVTHPEDDSLVWKSRNEFSYTNGNYAYHHKEKRLLRKNDNSIEEVDEEGVTVDIVSAV
ncbi:hypothetical protein FSP39_015849 [Pinctada imbricata]|uniref:Uncharacterized protein n=1 Tax=Pinctada imbricata TaxID=66713 RepID=A0AA89BPX1_PINIB|nr:hypothetical protein FSP39_015849 [Pinctada imbricata]